MAKSRYTYGFERFRRFHGFEGAIVGTFWAAWLSINIDWLFNEWFDLSILSTLTHGLVALDWGETAIYGAGTVGFVTSITIAVAWLLFLHTQGRLFYLWELPTRRTWLMSLILFWFFLMVVALFICAQWAVELFFEQIFTEATETIFWAIKTVVLYMSFCACTWLAYAILGPRVFHQQKMLSTALKIAIICSIWIGVVSTANLLVHITIGRHILTTYAIIAASWFGVIMAFYFGANLVFVQAKFGKIIPTSVRTQDADFLIAYRIVGYLWWAQNSGRQLNEKALLNVMTGANEDQVFDVLSHLAENNILHKTQNQHWALSRDLSSMTLLELYRACPGMPGNWRTVKLYGDPWDEVLEPLLIEASEHIERLWSLELRQLYSTSGPFASTSV